MVDYLSNGRMLPAFGIGVGAGARVPRRRRALQGARAPHRRGHRDHAALLDRGRGHVRGRVLASRSHHGAAASRPAAAAAVDRRQQRAGHAAGRAAGRRLDPLVHHARTSSAWASRRPRPSRPRRAARCPPITSACSSTAASIPTRRPPARWRAPFIPRGRVDDADPGALHRLRSGRARSRAAGGVRRGRRLEVHRAADVPARPDARSARPARQRRHSRPSSALITLGRRLDRRVRRSAPAQDVDQQPRVDVPAGEDHAHARVLRNRQAAREHGGGRDRAGRLHARCARGGPGSAPRPAPRRRSPAAMSVRLARRIGEGQRPRRHGARMPSAIVGGGGIVTRSPLRIDRYVSLAVSGSTPKTCIPGNSVAGHRRAAGHETAAADRREQHVERGHVLEQLERGRPLPGHDRGIVVGRHQHASRRAPSARRDELLAVVLQAVVEDDLGAVVARGLQLERRARPWACR